MTRRACTPCFLSNLTVQTVSAGTALVSGRNRLRGDRVANGLFQFVTGGSGRNGLPAHIRQNASRATQPDDRIVAGDLVQGPEHKASVSCPFHDSAFLWISVCRS